MQPMQPMMEDPSGAPVELGPVLSEHRGKLTSLAWLLLLCAFCFAVAVALLVVALDEYETVEILKRVGMAALFAAGGSILVWAAWRTARTRVELTDEGLHHTYRETVAVRWEDIGIIEVHRMSGRLTSLTLHARGRHLLVGRELSDFSTIVRALESRGLLPADFVE